MLVGALADAGADRQCLAFALDSLGTGAALRFETVKRCGIAATKFHVDATDTRQHRHLPHILKMIDGASALPERVKQNAAAVFQRLGGAEVGGPPVPIGYVHFQGGGPGVSLIAIVGRRPALVVMGKKTTVCPPADC